MGRGWRRTVTTMGLALATAVAAPPAGGAQAVDPLRGAGMEPALGELRIALAQLRSGLEGTRLTSRRSAEAAGELQRALGELRRGAASPLPQDPADSLYRAAREALNRGAYARSAALFAEIRERHPRSGYVPDSFYFQALALQRAGGTRRLGEARVLLDAMLREHEDAGTAPDARALRVRVQGALARHGDARAGMEVARQATTPCEGDQELRVAALSALLQMDPDQATPILKEVLRDRDECSAELRKQAVFILSQRGAPDAETVDLLLQLAHGDPDPDPEVREAAVFWLSQVDAPQALDALASILSDPAADPELQEKAVFAVSQHESPRAGEILRDYASREDVPTEIRADAVFWLGENPELAGDGFLRELYGEVRDPELRERILFSVARSEEPASGAWLLERARDPSEAPELRKNALFWAGESGAVDVEALEAIYGSVEDPELKEQVIFVLAQGNEPGAVDALMRIAEDEEAGELRQKAVFWLGQSDDPRVADFLVRLLRGGR